MLQVLITGDKSPTLYHPELHETYHSVNGAWTESRHVFINAGLLFMPIGAEISILEVGFGTGLNALLTVKEGVDRVAKIQYHTLETNILDLELIAQLNLHHLSEIGSAEEIMQMHAAPWNKAIPISERFTLFKHPVSLQAFQSTIGFDLVYFDAFGPDKQPELWTPEIFEKLYQMMNPGGILVTYSAKGEVRRNLKACGFEVERLPGPPLKRHMTRARKG